MLRKWKELPLDHGIVRLQQIDSDSIYVFNGGNSDGDVLIRIHRDKDLSGTEQFSANLQRSCKLVSLNIKTSEFPKMWSKGGSFRR